MAGQTDLESRTTPVPDLIERYKVRRDAWIAQADELARLRDEVRGSAEREALEIVTAARRDVRRVIMEARRELLVLSAQVQAALGEATPKPEPVALLLPTDVAPDPEHTPALTSGPSRVTLVPEAAVDEILDEVRADMTALTEDARALPLQVVGPAQPIPPAEGIPGSVVEAAAPPPTEPASVPGLTDLTGSAEFTAQFGAAVPVEEAGAHLPSWMSDAVPVHGDRRVTIFVAAFAGVAVLVAATTLWWLFGGSRDDQPASTEARSVNTPPVEAEPTSEPAAPAPAAAASVAPPAVPAVPPGKLLVVAEAVREVWVRTTIDGRVDDGRTLAAGQVINLTADESISLRVGDAGAMKVSVGPGERQLLGRDGQVVTRNYSVEEARPQQGVAVPPIDPRAAAAGLPPVGQPATVAPPASALPVPPEPSASAVIQSPTSTQTPAIPPAATPAVPANQATSNAPTGPQGTPLTAPPLAAPSNNASLSSAPSVGAVVVSAARQWLDAYHRQDRAAMSALSTDNLLLADERGAEERFPPGAGNVTRTLDRISVQVAADTAVLTAVMTEQSGAQPPRVSPISQVWVLAGAGQWKVRQARFVSEARLNQIFR